MEAMSDEEEVEEIPTRVVSSEVVVNVRAQVESYDFEGLSDCHSISTILNNVAPRHLVIAYATAQVAPPPPPPPTPSSGQPI
jgi:hypothetical protein